MRRIPEPGLLSLSDLVERLVHDARFEAENTGRCVEGSIAQHCFAWGDVVLLRRAVENVLRNAIRYTPAHGRIRVSLVCSPDGSSAVITVEDEGPGIPEEEITSIVQPFYRVDRSRSGDTGGSGVGLSIASRAVTLHHGELTFRNRHGGGLSASITLPLTTVSESM
jgi:two-component system sensor histidine kinase CpxA